MQASEHASSFAYRVANNISRWANFLDRTADLACIERQRFHFARHVPKAVALAGFSIGLHMTGSRQKSPTNAPRR